MIFKTKPTIWDLKFHGNVAWNRCVVPPFIQLLVFLIFLNVVPACKTNPGQLSEETKTYPITIDVLDASKDFREFPLSRLIQDVDIISFESTPESYFSMFTSLDVSDHYFLIASEKEDNVLLFNREGKFIRTIGRKGRGPGEYLHPHYAGIDPKEQYVIVIDEMTRIILKYSVEGTLMAQSFFDRKCKTKANFQPVFIDDSHFAVSFERPLAPTEDFSSIAVFNQDLQMVRQVLMKPNNDSLCLTNLSNQRIIRSDRSLMFWERFVDTLYSFSLQSQPKALYYFNLGGTGQTLNFLTGREVFKTGFDFNLIIGPVDLPDYFIFIFCSNDRLQPMILDKKTNEAFAVQRSRNCIEAEAGPEIISVWENDVFGIPQIILSSYYPEFGFITSPMYIEDVWPLDKSCLKNLNVLKPDKRDQVIQYLDSYTGAENPLLLLLHVKQKR